MNQPIFDHGSVPISVVAQLYKKSANWVRAGIIEGWLPIGIATRDGKEVTSISQQNSKHRINYYVSPKLLYEETGFIWRKDYEQTESRVEQEEPVLYPPREVL